MHLLDLFRPIKVLEIQPMRRKTFLPQGRLPKVRLGLLLVLLRTTGADLSRM